MVSGRSEATVNCSKCGQPRVELDLADRVNQICAVCVADEANKIQQLSLLPRRLLQKLIPVKRRKTPEARAVEEKPEPELDQLALFETPPKPVEEKPQKKSEPIDYRHLVLCEVCRRKLDPTVEPWFGATCEKCWPDNPEARTYFMERWRQYTCSN